MKQETIDRIRKFTEDREWEQFHSPGNLAKSIVIEAAELLECFQWNDKEYDLQHVKEELVCEGYIEDLEDPRESSKTCNLESYAIVKRNNDTNYNMDIEYSACLKCSNYKSPACSNPISGIKRLKASIDCEVK